MGSEKRDPVAEGAEFSRLLAVLPKLTKGQRAQLMAGAELLGCEAEATPSEADAREYVHTAIATVLKEEYGMRCLPISKATSLVPKFKAEATDLVEYVDRELHPKTRNERRALLKLLVKYLVHWMQEARVHIAFKSIVQQLSQVPVILERQLPGYRQDGLLHLVLGQLRAGLAVV